MYAYTMLQHSCSFARIVEQLTKGFKNLLLRTFSYLPLVKLLNPLHSGVYDRNMHSTQEFHWNYVHALLTLQLIDVNDGMRTNPVPNGR